MLRSSGVYISGAKQYRRLCPASAFIARAWVAASAARLKGPSGPARLPSVFKKQKVKIHPLHRGTISAEQGKKAPSKRREKLPRSVEQVGLLLEHRFRFRGARFVGMAQEMQDAVDGHECQLLLGSAGLGAAVFVRFG